MALSGFKLHKFCFPKDSNHTETPKWCYRYYAVNPTMTDASMDNPNGFFPTFGTLACVLLTYKERASKASLFVGSDLLCLMG